MRQSLTSYSGSCCAGCVWWPCGVSPQACLCCCSWEGMLVLMPCGFCTLWWGCQSHHLPASLECQRATSHVPAASAKAQGHTVHPSSPQAQKSERVMKPLRDDAMLRSWPCQDAYDQFWEEPLLWVPRAQSLCRLSLGDSQEHSNPLLAQACLGSAAQSFKSHTSPGGGTQILGSPTDHP